MPADDACPRCHERLAAQAAVRLWDGRDYCRACVDRACEGLADYAAAHPRLEERQPFSLRSGLRNAASALLGAAAFVGFLGGLAGFDAGGGARIAVGAAIGALLGAALLGISALIATWFRRRLHQAGPTPGPKVET